MRDDQEPADDQTPADDERTEVACDYQMVVEREVMPDGRSIIFYSLHSSGTG